ncbi:SH3 domain-containing protein [Chryseobacterium sp. GVT01B]|uniref:SH3 domain-containing protein n=1 Tax=Chryseobacterium sp. GVT01B TaxID=2862675 RepID=UPI001CBFA9BF|nr:SH3 domain-containing protein [Chryseobacterium sp. GVT01B]
MKGFSFFLFILLSVCSYSQVSVRGYYRKDGTYVRPHERTAPNSTITDNYSYRGNYNPNLEYNTISTRNSSSTYNYYDNSSANYDKEWVNGYYKTDGTYVNGYYRKKRKTTTSYSSNSTYNYYNKSNSTYSTKKYVNTTNVNFRTTPEVRDNIIAELSFSDEVTFVETLGYWDKVKVKQYNPNTYSYSMIEGYINSRYLTTVENTYSNTIVASESKNFKVSVNKTYFCTTPNIKDMRKAFLVYGDRVYGIAESKYFIYTEFTNSYGQKSVGWILKDDLIRE